MISVLTFKLLWLPKSWSGKNSPTKTVTKSWLKGDSERQLLTTPTSINHIHPYPLITIYHHASFNIIHIHSPFLTCPSIPSDKKSLIKLLLKNAQLGSSLIPRSCDVTCGAPQKNLPLQHLSTYTYLITALKCGETHYFSSGFQLLQWLMCRFLCEMDVNTCQFACKAGFSTARSKRLRSRQCWRNFEPLPRQTNYSKYSILNIFNLSKTNATYVQFNNLQKPKHAGAIQSLDQWSWSCHTDVVSNGTELASTSN